MHATSFTALGANAALQCAFPPNCKAAQCCRGPQRPAFTQRSLGQGLSIRFRGEFSSLTCMKSPRISPAISKTMAVLPTAAAVLNKALFAPGRGIVT
jgi:hypothetical protein